MEMKLAISTGNNSTILFGYNENAEFATQRAKMLKSEEYALFERWIQDWEKPLVVLLSIVLAITLASHLTA